MDYQLALVHDYLTDIGGAEMTLKAMAETWEKVPIYTLLYKKENFSKDPDYLLKFFQEREVKASFLNNLPGFIRNNKKLLLPFLAVAPETFDLREFDVVLASTGAFSKGIITKPNTLNICYCHSPSRFLWDYSHEYLREINARKSTKLFARFFLNYLRLWDASAAKRPDFLLANSRTTQQKLKKYYRRDSKVIYPPVEISEIQEKIKPFEKKGDYFLMVTRLSPYKKVDMVIEAFNKLNWPLVIIGAGPQFDKLKKRAGPKVKLLGQQSREKTLKYFAGCRACIQAGDEDFGIVAVEAMAAGKPVLALKRGGALETVLPGETGEFFEEALPEIIAEAAFRLNKRIGREEYNSDKIKEHSRQFSKERFQREIKDFVEEKLNS